MVSDTIQFLLNDKIYKVKNPDPNKTILNYVRNDLKKTGTKEGCAEGGCGACTVVLGELNNNKIIYKSINACISFLPILNGKQLILIEDLVFKNKPHMVQEALIKFHGSQCGFCTPGFTMSLFSLQKNHKLINNENIEEALSGNLCRCTGYRPIIDAAKSLNNKKDQDHFKIELFTY
jgi:xanthine dehydrogenase small subunit